MAERDKRWERMWARIGPLEISGDDLETGYYKTKEKFVEIRIEVPHNRTTWYQVQCIHKDDYKELLGDPKIFDWILTQMIAKIDERLDGG